MRINLAKDPSLRSKTTAAFRPLGGATLSYEPEYAFYGQGSLKITRSGQSNVGVVIAEPIPVVAGQSYAFSVYGRIPVTVPRAENASLILRAAWQRSNGSEVIDNITAELQIDTDTTWYRVGGVWTAPSGATNVSVSIYQQAPPTPGSVVYLDALLVEQSSYIGGYFDNLTVGERMNIVNTGLSRVPQVINGVRLGADILLNDLVLNTIDEDDTIWIVTDLTGWWGQTDPELPDIPRGTEDGSYDVQGRLQSRTITLSGFFIPKNAEGALSASIDRLVTAAHLVRRGGWFMANEVPTKAAWVRLSASPNIKTVNARGKTEFQITLRAGDPIKYHWSDEDPDGYTTAQFNDPIIIDRVITNLATHGTFELSGSSTEVRRNLFPDPYMTSITHVSTVEGQSTAALSADGVRWTLDTDAAIGINLVAGTGLDTGDSARLLVRVRANREVSVTPRIRGTAITSQARTLSTTWEWLDFRGTAGATETATGFVLASGGGHAEGDWIEISHALIALGTDSGEHFGGASSPDADTTASWIGAANTSASILTGTAVSTYPSLSGFKAIKSSLWKASGSSSLRQIPTRTSRGSGYTEIANQTTARGLIRGRVYTAMAVLRQEALHNFEVPVAYARSIALVNTTNGSLDAVVNGEDLVGTQTVRLIFGVPQGGDWSLRLYHGGRAGDADIWWDNLAIIEGAYADDYFDGSTPNTDEYQNAWTSTVNASTSTREIHARDTITNIGTADVSGMFTITGPAGAGTYINNATTGQTMVLAQALRGAGLVAEIEYAEAMNNIATVYTVEPHGLREGDHISTLNMVLPFSQSSEDRIVTAVSEVYPYSFSYAMMTDDVDKIPSGGEVYLDNNDTLTINTYDRSVTYNGEVAGHRNKLTTLTDWVTFTSGDNVIDFKDVVTKVPVKGKALTSNVVTLTTEDIHYLIPGEEINVQLSVDMPLARKSLTANKVTLTTPTPHGYAVGDLIDVESTETSQIVDKSRTSNVVSLTTQASHGISVGDRVTVAMPATMAMRYKALTGNVATITSQNPHGFSAGDSIQVTMPTSAIIATKSVSNNQAILGTTTPHGFVVGDQITVALPVASTVTAKSRSGNRVTITTSAAHGYSVGDTINITLPTSRTLTGTRSASATTGLLTLTTSAAHGYSVGDYVTLTLDGGDPVTISDRSATSTVCTLTVPTGHDFLVGDKITVAGVTSRYNGTFYVTAVTATSVSYAKSGAVEASVASAGSVTNVTIASHYNGSKVVETIPSTTTFTVRSYDQTVSIADGGTVTGTVVNDTNDIYNGAKEVASTPSTTTFTYNI